MAGVSDILDGGSNMITLKFLEDALENARQGERHVAKWMEEVRGSSDSFYTRTKTAKGIDAAELELEEVVQRRKYREVSVMITKIIAGVAELAKAEIKEPLVELIADPASLPLAVMVLRSHFSGQYKVLVATNKSPDFFHYNELRNSEVWSLGGTLGLQAIVVVVNERTGEVSLSLMLVPPFKFGYHNEKSEGYVLATLTTGGDIRFDTLTSKFRQHASVWYALGKIPNDRLIENSHMSGGEHDHHLGFPGAYDYLIRNLDGLGEYLTDLAVLVAKKK